MAREPTIATGFRITESLYWEFKRKAVERHVSDTEAVRQAFRNWVNKKSAGAIAPSPDSDYAEADSEITEREKRGDEGA